MQPPGRETRFGEPVVTEPSALLEDLATPVGMLADLPIAFLGYSFGALLAFELACHVRARFGIRLQAFVACAFPPPHGLPPQPPDGSPPVDSELIAILRNLGGTPPEVLADPELLALQLRPLRADYTILARYPRGPARAIDCPILALSGRQDRHAGPEIMQGWAEASGGEFSLRDFSGGHFFVFDHLQASCQTVFAHVSAR